MKSAISWLLKQDLFEDGELVSLSVAFHGKVRSADLTGRSIPIGRFELSELILRLLWIKVKNDGVAPEGNSGLGKNLHVCRATVTPLPGHVKALLGGTAFHVSHDGRIRRRFGQVGQSPIRQERAQFNSEELELSRVLVQRNAIGEFDEPSLFTRDAARSVPHSQRSFSGTGGSSRRSRVLDSGFKLLLHDFRRRLGILNDGFNGFRDLNLLIRDFDRRRITNFGQGRIDPKSFVGGTILKSAG